MRLLSLSGKCDCKGKHYFTACNAFHPACYEKLTFYVKAAPRLVEVGRYVVARAVVAILWFGLWDLVACAGGLMDAAAGGGCHAGA